ncbi:UPF0193 protein EVG1 [Chiloscyllium plagiosum]|uniref:UPF0193 protein EVG1 n=1 Tax=Chiloscyllium plagiosum TaxID=36176 RepID=UPI001CB83A6D|nr:UPF0193 protein EVG1 [Chiloscyllium plagiosum]
MNLKLDDCEITCFEASKIKQNVFRKLIREPKGEAFPVSCHPSSSKVSAAPPLPPAPCVRVQPSSKPHLRPAESCRAGDAYVRERFRPRPTNPMKPSGQTWKRNLVADDHSAALCLLMKQPSPPSSLEHQFKDTLRGRVLSVGEGATAVMCNEIEERRQFLEQMESFGRGKEFRAIIQTEISQKLKEMEVIDRTRNHELEMATRERDRGNTCKSQLQVKNGNNA